MALNKDYSKLQM